MDLFSAALDLDVFMFNNRCDFTKQYVGLSDCLYNTSFNV